MQLIREWTKKEKIKDEGFEGFEGGEKSRHPESDAFSMLIRGAIGAYQV